MEIDVKNYEKLKGFTVDASSLLKMLKKSGHNITVPINVKQIIEILDIPVEIKPDFKKAKITGSISLKDGDLEIWINPLMNQTKERQRFTMAHELGHFMLQLAPTFKDKDYIDETITYNRDENWSLDEMMANRFAAELLMPEKYIKEEYEKIISSNDKNNIVEKMAKIFEVSTQAMGFRLKGLNYEY